MTLAEPPARKSQRSGLAIVDPIEVVLTRADVAAFLDYPAGRLPPARIEALLDEMVAEAQRLVRAKGAYRWLDAAESSRVGLETVAAEALVIGLVTAGPAIEARASELLATGELTRAVLLDAAGSAAAEAAADELGRRLGEGAAAEADPTTRASELASRDGGPQLVDGDARPSAPSARVRDSHVSCRLSPGYGRWTLRWQRELFARLPHRELGVELNDSCLMLPRKSISFAMWLGARERIAQGIAGCSDCTLGQCRYRRRAAGSADSDHERGSSP